VRGEKVLQAVFDVRHYPGQGLAAHDYPWPAHTKVLVVLETQQPELLLVAAARLSDEHWLAAVHRPEQRGQPVRANVHVVVGPHEPLVRAAVVVPHVLQHQERLFLRRVRVVHRRQPDERQVGRAGRPDRRLRAVEHHAAGHATRPRAVDRGRSGGQVPVGRHHADEQQRFGRASGTAAAGCGYRSTAIVLVDAGPRRLQRPQHAGPTGIATATGAAVAATGVQPQSVVRSAERVADKQSEDDAGQHVRQTPPAVAGGFLLAAGRRPLFLDHGLVRVVVLLLRRPL